ncbi:MAG: DUF4377 domain-containing protein [Cyclobacteriaceae bacterium]
MKLRRVFLSHFVFSIMLLFSGCSDEMIAENIVDMRVNHYTVTCEGASIGNCLLVQEGDQIGSVDWDYFYFENSIEGFDYEPGFIYDLKIKKTTIENPPADGSSILYELVKIQSKTQV